MKLQWIIEPEEVYRIQAFVAKHRSNAHVLERIQNNLRSDKPPVSLTEFWEKLVGCLLTTQQPSGPNSPLVRFMATRPFPLSFEECQRAAVVESFCSDVLQQFGGLRRYLIISREVSANFAFLQGRGWEQALAHLEAVRINSTPETERLAADFLADHLRGVGPKQSRNLLQWLGLSRYETPIDSRISRWLNDFGFPFRLSAAALANREYFCLVTEGFQQMAAACDIAPCVLDAAIFASFDTKRVDSFECEEVIR